MCVVRILSSFYFLLDITVTSTLIRDVMRKLEELNSTVGKLEEKNKRLEGLLSNCNFK